MIASVAKALGSMLTAPIRRRRSPTDTPPAGREHYEPTLLAASCDAALLKAADIPVAKTPEQGWSGSDWPAPVLAGCDEPLVDGAPDLRGVWRVEKGPLKGHVERVEQAGDRVVITAGGVIHDMFVNGTLEGGVNDVSEAGTQISVAARFEDGRHNLYPGNKRVVAVTRYLDGDEMVWRWGPWRNRLRRLDGPTE
ncbi:MAG: hypothetical protein GKR86_03700 [Ilumatobacter sp.]|nr:hypothetical protein [Ilumatobacter sp.]